MPKNHKPKGGRPSANFEPRYAKKTSFRDRHAGGRPTGRDERSDTAERRTPSGPGSRSPKHRGYRPESEGAQKQRWGASERAGRDEARGIRNRAESGRREAPHHDRRSDDRAPRNDRYSGDRSGYGTRRYDDDRRSSGSYGDRDDRRSYGDRNGSRDGGRRDDRGGRPSYGDRDQRRSYGDRDDRRSSGSYGDRDQRGSYGDRNSSGSRGYDRNSSRDGARRDDRGGRPSYGDRDQPRSYGERDGARRDDRGGRPSYGDRDERRSSGSYGDRNSSSARGHDRSASRDGARDERGGRPSYGDRDQRRSYGDRDDRRSSGSYGDRTERPRRSGDRPRRADDRHDGASRRERDSRPTRSDWNRPATVAAQQQVEDVVHERLEAQTVQAEEVADVTFADLGLGSNIVEVLANMGAEKPFPIQAASVPAVLEGRDVLARGRTGSGKTIAFGAPLVESILLSQKGKKREFARAPRAIILAPTRELALQIDRTVQPIARSVGLFTTQIYGGVPQARQVGALKKGVDIVIGTPGRIEDLINQGKLDLSEVRIAVLDEADHMCELGFVEPVQRILRHTGTALEDGASSQKLLFSATLDREVASLVDEFLVEPAVFEVAGETQDSGTIDHRVLVVEHRDKADILSSLVDRDGRTLVFSRTRAFAEMLAEQFEDAGIPAVSLHGDLNQAKRTRNLEKLTRGKVNVLVATDVAARGIHVDDIDLVVQADAPDEYKTYLHRAGRTGRAGRSGTVVTLITRHRRRRMEELLERAEIDAPFEQAAPGDDILEELAGRLPSDAELTA
ncbi:MULTISPECIES: DEAD/DEAH box helicase [unclassified Microbacterium]|uniref:DEAD/DEAH box helicase n=1 Tax=unclassified Microbacterium TaxID=2609290 RepID=UPI0013814AFB|nr:DEAD/DEAH box helicase [Microbacterium sp. MAH-37]